MYRTLIDSEPISSNVISCYCHFIEQILKVAADEELKVNLKNTVSLTTV
jgi:hypothetical protein